MSTVRATHIPETIPVLESHRVDEDVLRRYLEAWHLEAWTLDNPHDP